MLAGLLSLLLACNNLLQPAATAPATVKLEEEAPKLRILWNQGFYPEEDQMIQTVIEQWEAENGIEVELTMMGMDDGLRYIQESLDAGNPPDIAFNWGLNTSLSHRLAWDGELADVTAVITPVETLYSPAALESVKLFNKAGNNRSYYAVPIEQSGLHIFYWRDLLVEAGYSESDIPETWDAFWEFWQKVQKKLAAKRANKGGDPLYALGLPMSPSATDTPYIFEQALEANNIRILDENGMLTLDDPRVRQGIISVLTWYTGFYKEGYVPPGAVKWTDAGNNFAFFNRLVVMTPNATLSIPAQLKKNPELYSKLKTQGFPLKVDGAPIPYLTSVEHVVIFEQAANKEAAIQFLSFLVQPEHLGLYVKGSQGRWIPVMTPLLEDPFWSSGEDPHIKVAIASFRSEATIPFYHTLNPAYSSVEAENVWGQAINRVVVDNVPPQKAADEAIDRIQSIFADPRWVIE